MYIISSIQPSRAYSPNPLITDAMPWSLLHSKLKNRSNYDIVPLTCVMHVLRSVCMVRIVLNRLAATTSMAFSQTLSGICMHPSIGIRTRVISSQVGPIHFPSLPIISPLLRTQDASLRLIHPPASPVRPVLPGLRTMPKPLYHAQPRSSTLQ